MWELEKPFPILGKRNDGILVNQLHRHRGVQFQRQKDDRTQEHATES